MAGNNAFNTQGSNPNNPFNTYRPGSLSGYNPLSSGSTPVAKALNSVQAGGTQAPANSFMVNQLAPAPTASTPLKKTTIANVDGSSMTHEYHAPPTSGLISGGSAPATAPATTPPPSAYSQVSGGLINQGTTVPAPVDTATTGLGNAPAQNQVYADRAKQIADEAGSQIANIGTTAAGQEAGYRTTGTAPVGEGNAAIVAQTAAARQNAITQGANMQLSGNAQGLTAQGQAQSGLLNSGNLGVSAKGQQTTALGTAGGLIPEALRFGGAGGGLDPNTTAQTLAQKVVSGQMTYDDAAASLGYAGSAGQQFLNNAIQTLKPGFNIPVSRGQAAANQQNTTTAGTAATNAYASTYSQNYPRALEIQGYLQNVQDLGKLLVDTATGAAINPFNLTYANDTLNSFKSKLSDSGQAQFANTLATYQGAVSQLLSGSTSVNPTQVAQWTQDIANGSMKLSTLKDVYNQALREGNIKLNTAQTLTNIPGQQLGAPAVSGGQAGTKGQTSGGNGYTIIP